MRKAVMAIPHMGHMQSGGQDEIRVAEEELAAFIEDSIKASRGEQKAVAILPFQTFLRRFLAQKEFQGLGCGGLVVGFKHFRI